MPQIEPAIDNSPILRRVLQTVSDIAHRPLNGLRILDIACAHGVYSIELARRGADVVGIEGRDEWLEIARRTKNALSLSNVTFVQDDVRNLNEAKYGSFDIVLCLGILYHLDSPSLFELVDNVSKVCRDFAVFETHVAGAPVTSYPWRDRQYWGETFREHAPGATDVEKLKVLGASLNNEMSVWLTRPSLCNLLRHVGFTSVYDCKNPMANLYVGPNRDFKVWGNRVTLAAIKGQPVKITMAPNVTVQPEADWPESLEPYLYEEFLRRPQK